jgi:hypothetical protein
VRRIWLKSLLLCLGSFSLLWGAGAGTLWDPHEVTVAELSRRIALNLLGGGGLAVPDAVNSVPIRADLGRGELPFTSAALGFRLFGLSDWAGRLPLTLWALLGALVLYVGVGRLWDRRAALYALLALVTMPLYFLQARSLLGDAVTLASFAIAWSGLAVAVLAPDQSTRARLGFAALGALGLYAGFWCRGPIASVAVPALAVGASALLFRPVSARLARGLAWGMTLLGSAALVAGLAALEQQRASGDYSVWVGSAVAAPAQLPHFAVPLAAFMHACFPWSALAPLGLLLPWQSAEPSARASASVSGAAVLALGASLAATAWLAPALGVYASPGAVCLPVLLAGGLRELERGPRRAALLGFVVAALALVVGLDLRVYPDKALVGLGIEGALLPEALTTWSQRLWTGSSAALAFASLLCLYEDQEQLESSPRFDRAEYDRVLKSLQELWHGNLVFALLLVEAALVGFLLLSAISERLVTLPQLEGFGSFWRTAVAVSAVAVPLLALLPLVTMLLRDIGRALFHGAWLGPWQPLLRPTRAQGLLAVGVAIGAIASLGFYPAVSRQVAPKQVFERYRELRQPGELLGLLGQQSQAARYQGGESSVHLADGAQALAFLSEGGSTGKRRFLLLRKADLGPLNAAFRERHLGNLPILDGRSSEVLLAVNRRFPRREPDESPLGQLVLDAAPPPQHRVRAVLGQRQLEVLGYSVASPAGQLETSLQPATRYRFIIYFRVLARIGGDWQVFVHLDGLQRRFNADHEPAEGKYPLELWREGDVIADATDVVLEPSFSPGAYRVYFGLFSGERRIEVIEGAEDDDRIAAGTLQIR